MRLPGFARSGGGYLWRGSSAMWLRLHLNEVGPLVSLLALSTLGYGFFALAREVGEGSTAALDRKILLALRNPADIIAWPEGKLAVNTSMPCGTRSGLGR